MERVIKGTDDAEQIREIARSVEWQKCLNKNKDNRAEEQVLRDELFAESMKYVPTAVLGILEWVPRRLAPQPTGPPASFLIEP